MKKNSRIYVAGHRGLVGSAIVRHLTQNAYSNIILRTRAELDLMDPLAVATFFKSEIPDYVFLAAARVGGIHANNSYPAEFIFQNLMIQNNIIHQSYLSSVKKLLFLGSSCIYPKNCPQPMKKEYLLTGPLEQTNSPYAVSKIAGIEMCHAYNRQYGTLFIPVMPTNLYGPNDNFDLESSHVLPAMIRKFHLAKLAAEKNLDAINRDESIFGPIPLDIRKQLVNTISGENQTVQLWGTGVPRREFLYVDDLSAACVYLMQTPASKILTGQHTLINIGVGEDISIEGLASKIAEIIGYEGEIIFDASKPDGTPQKLLDVSKIQNMGWKAKSDLDSGIRKTYNWYKKSD